MQGLSEEMHEIKITVQEGLSHDIEVLDLVRNISTRVSLIEQLFPTNRTYVVTIPPN